MSNYTTITLETAKRLGVPQELDLARRAHAAMPGSHRARLHLANLLIHVDAFDEAVVLLDGADSLDHGETMMLIQALLSRETAEADERVLALADRACALADSDVARSATLADRAKAEVRRGLPCARKTLAEALRLDPHNRNACKRLAALQLKAGEFDAVLRLVDDLERQGVGHSRLLAARTLALAAVKKVEAARASVGLDRFLHQAKIAAPPGWDSLEAFNAALVEQLLAHPGLRWERYGSASEQTWRVDKPLSRAAPLVAVLFEQIRRSIDDHLATIADQDHPWMRQRPQEGTLHGWCVITESTGYETWHVHQFGWLSGVYYAQIPEAITQGSDAGGCIAWGVPDDLMSADAAAAYGERRVRPEPGMLLLFPSHAYHRTFPHRLADRRICLAFDILPH